MRSWCYLCFLQSNARQPGNRQDKGISYFSSCHYDAAEYPVTTSCYTMSIGQRTQKFLKRVLPSSGSTSPRRVQWLTLKLKALSSTATSANTSRHNSNTSRHKHQLTQLKHQSKQLKHQSTQLKLRKELNIQKSPVTFNFTKPTKCT